MGFFSSLSGVLGGGSQSKSSGQNSSGFSLLPQSIQNSYTGYADQLNNVMANPAAVTKAYTPTPFSGAENNAISNVNTGFAPTASSINSDVAMQQNPYDQYVIDEINRQAGGQYSVLKQAQEGAGQSGSNRGMLGANDIDLSRLNQIGGFKQNQYNTAMNNALTTLPNARAADASNQLNVGNEVRGLTDATNQSQFTGLEQIAKLLGILPTNGGSQGTNSSSSSSSQNGTLGNLASAVGSFFI